MASKRRPHPRPLPSLQAAAAAPPRTLTSDVWRAVWRAALRTALAADSVRRSFINKVARQSQLISQSSFNEISQTLARIPIGYTNRSKWTTNSEEKQLACVSACLGNLCGCQARIFYHDIFGTSFDWRRNTGPPFCLLPITYTPVRCNT